MHVKETIGAGIVATSVMTAFSYAVSAVEKKNFKEPLLLSLFIKRLTPVQNPLLDVSGWVLHYTLGSVWAGVGTLWMEPFHSKPSFWRRMLLSCFSGAVAIAVWKVLFLRHPHPPKTDQSAFYRQLFVAHLLFTFSLAETCVRLKRKRSPKTLH